MSSSLLRQCAALVTFVFLLALYLAALAPSVTLEDSGELITAAYSLGVPHEPGYPLFTIVGKLFTLIPLGSIAYRVNLASAVLAALACAIATLATCRLVRAPRTAGLVIAAAASFVLVGASRDFFSQAIITEVYALNAFFFALLLYLLVRFRDAAAEQRDHWFLAYCLACGLMLCNHHTSLVFMPFGLLFVWVMEPGYLRNARRLATGALAFVLGLTPYLYLPLSAAHHPSMNWGDPSSVRTFIGVITRSQYLKVVQGRSIAQIASQTEIWLELLCEQFSPLFLVGAIAGLIAAYKRERRLFWLALVLLFITGPLVAYAMNSTLIDVPPRLRAEEKDLVSVMFLPNCLFIGVLMAVGWAAIVRRWAPRRASVIAALAFVLCAGMGIARARKDSMHDHHFAQALLTNLRQISPGPTLVMGNWDPFVFPFIYFQQVEGQAKDVVFIDVELLRRSWYIAQVRQWYPETLARSQAECDAFLQAVAPFERSEPYDGGAIQEKYVAMVRSLFSRNAVDHRLLLTIFQPMRGFDRTMIPPELTLSPCLVAYCLDSGPPSTAIDNAAFDFSGLSGTLPSDRMALMLGNYYAILHAQRAAFLGDRDPANAARHMRTASALVNDTDIKKMLRLP